MPWRRIPSCGPVGRAEACRRALDAAFDPILTAPLPALHLTVAADAAGRVSGRARPMARLAWAAGFGGLIVGFAAGPEPGPA